jgi:hypothetical protein
MEVDKKTEARYNYQEGFREGVFSERHRLLAYLTEKSIIRLDAFGFWVKETMGDEVTELPDLDRDQLPERGDGKIFIHPSVIGAMMVRNHRAYSDEIERRLIVLRDLTPANSPSSLELTRWIVELEKKKESRDE